MILECVIKERVETILEGVEVTTTLVLVERTIDLLSVCSIQDIIVSNYIIWPSRGLRGRIVASSVILSI